MLADLDELVMKCRDERAKKYIDEAVRCYRASAYRSAVVATWIAICFDMVDKLRALAAAGDAQAEEKADALMKHQMAADYQSAMKFEESIPDLALQFEFISPTEKIDLQRLKIDRNRCAHPSHGADAELFEVSSELARLHIRNAVCHLLQHEPSQGKAALERLWADLRSDTFPRVQERVLARLQAGPLRRARDALVRNFITTLLKELVLTQYEKVLHEKIVLALLACREMHSHIWERAISGNIGTLAERAVSSTEILRFLYAMDEPLGKVFWNFLTEVQQERIKNFVKEAPSDIFEYLDLLNDELFQESRTVRYERATLEEILNSNPLKLEDLLQRRLISFAAKVDSFAAANRIFKFISVNSSDFSVDAFGAFVDAISNNRQAYDASGFSPLIKKFSERSDFDKVVLNEKLVANGLADWVIS